MVLLISVPVNVTSECLVSIDDSDHLVKFTAYRFLLGQNNGTEKASIATQFRGLDVIVQMVENFGMPEVAVKQKAEFLADELEELRLVHYAAAQKNALRRETDGQIHQRQR